MTALNVVLESFDGAENAFSKMSKGGEGVHAQQERAAAYAEGYAAGEAAALAKPDPQTELLKSVAGVLEKKAAEFQNNADANLCDGIAAIISKVFPALSEKGFAAEAVSVLAQTQISNTGLPIVVKTAPEHIELLRDAVTGFCESVQIEAEEDAGLSGAMVVAEWERGGMDFDTDKVIEQCLAALENAAQQLRNGKDDE